MPLVTDNTNLTSNPLTTGQGLLADVLYRIPLFYFLFGKVLRVIGSADKKRMIQKMERSESFGLLPGGFHEATIMAAGTDRVYLKKRQGFIKYALQYGYNLMPVYTFGEADTYLNHDGGYDWKFKLNDKSIPTIVPFGEWWCPLLPRYNTRLHSVAGRFVKSAS